MSNPTPKAVGVPEARAGAELGPITDWLFALPGMVQRLEQGARAAEVGCGRGAATLLLARRFPRSSFVGFDADSAAIEIARDLARQSGIVVHAQFEVAHAADFPGSGYQLILHLGGLRIAGDPLAAARHVRRALAPAGSWLLVEANDPSDARLRELLSQGGFSRFRRVTQSNSHGIFEARA